MGSKFHHILLALVCVAFVVNHAATLPAEEYWNSVLPNSPMPKAVKDLLQASELEKDKTTAVGGNKGGENIFGGRGILYRQVASETQLHYHPNATFFFLEKDMHAGQKMNLNFFHTPNQAKFLPRQVSDSIPFSSKKLPEIFSKFNPTSEEAEIMKKTIEECEDAGIKGEIKLCATSLESMVDFSTSQLGKNVQAISTIAQEKGQDSTPKEYGILRVTKMPSDKAAVVCHKVDYAYAVFYCHKTGETVAYEVSMVAKDGSKANAVAVCHKDTAEWNPKHLAFQVLKVKPGTVPICHFLIQDQIVWVPKY